MSNLWDFFSHEAGQARRNWLDDKTGDLMDGVKYYAGPYAPNLGLVGEMNPVQDVGYAMQDAREGDYLGMLTNTAAAVAPAVAGKVAKAYNPRMVDDAAQWVEDALMGFSMNPTRTGFGNAAGDFVGGESGALRLMQGRSKRGLTDFFNPDGVSWATTSRDTAEQFAGKSELSKHYPDYSGEVYDLDFDIKNPMEVSYRDTLWSRDKELAKIAEAKEAGHDGLKVIFNDDKTDYVAFDPAQVSQAPQLTPSQQSAQDVLDLLSEGRASEVTDPMMAAADDMYLFDNYDLPMDEASRMARARDMGFDTDTDLYHGTYADDDFQALKPSQRGKIGPGVYLSPDAKKASSFSGASEPFIVESHTPRNFPVVATNRPADEAARWAARDARNLYDGDAARGAGEEMARRGFDGVSVQDERTILNPANIRSRFARFDPRLKHLSNLSAGIAGIGLLGPAFYDQYTDQGM